MCSLMIAIGGLPVSFNTAVKLQSSGPGVCALNQ
jgi:hypothetical protein